MTAFAVITRLRQRGCLVCVEGDTLVVASPTGRPAPQRLLAELWRRREEAGPALREEARARGSIRCRIARALAAAGTPSAP